MRRNKIDIDKLKQTKNIFEKLVKDDESVFYGVDRVKRLLLGKAKKTLCEKDKVFYKCYLHLEDKDVSYESKDPKKSISFYTLFVEQKKDIERLSTLYSINASFKLMHVDIADIRFFSKSIVDPKYCLLAAGLFCSKTYNSPMKGRHLLVQKMGLLYQVI